MSKSVCGYLAVVICSLAASVYLCGCESSGSKARSPYEVPLSGFLSDYSNLEPGPDSGLRYIDKDNRLYRYTKFIIDPVVLYRHDQSQVSAVDPSITRRLRQSMHEALVRAVSQRYQVVSEPGRGIARVRVALTDLRGPAATESGSVKPGIMTMEGEVVDSVTGRQIAAAVHSQTGKARSLESEVDWSYVQQVLDGWARKFRSRIDEAREDLIY